MEVQETDEFSRKLKEFTKNAQQVNIFEDIHNYRELMTITQVIKFFKSKNIVFTKTMIQNYTRVNVIPPLIDKRYYNKEHLIILAITDSLKSVYSLDEIKKITERIKKDDYLVFYSNYINLTNELMLDWQKYILNRFKKSENMQNDFALPMMAQSTAIKKIISHVIFYL